MNKEESRKTRGRVRGAKATVGPPEVDGANIRFSTNGNAYLVNVVQKYQQNLNSGNRRAVLRKGNKWFFDTRSLRKGNNLANAKWTAYSSELQPLLESALRLIMGLDAVTSSDNADVGIGEATSDLQKNQLCSSGHALRLDPRWNHTCNVCDTRGTQYRCFDGCDFDMCKHCSRQLVQRSHPDSSFEDMLVTAIEAPPRSLALPEVRATCEALLRLSGDSANYGRVPQSLEALVDQQGLVFEVEDVRRVAFQGNVSILKMVLCSAPQVQVLGHEIFDRRCPGIVLSEDIKLCVRLLLARGAQIGKFAPASKLLRKVEADVQGVWVHRYFYSLAIAGIELPDNVQQSVLDFFG